MNTAEHVNNTNTTDTTKTTNATNIPQLDLPSYPPLGSLSAQYESNGDPSCISTGYLDPGGKSYGIYQLSLNAGSLREFVDWLLAHPQLHVVAYGQHLDQYNPGSIKFDAMWRQIATLDPDGFTDLQHDYMQAMYYDVAAAALLDHLFDVNKHSHALKDVVWSRAVQYGPYQVPSMFRDALVLMGQRLNLNLPNLSYIDHIRFDWDLIAAVYDTCMTHKWNQTKLRDALNERFRSEKNDALKALEEELGIGK